MKYPLRDFVGPDTVLIVSLENLHAGADDELDYDAVSMGVEAAAADLDVDVEIVDGTTGMAFVQMFEALDASMLDEIDFAGLFDEEDAFDGADEPNRVKRRDLEQNPEEAIQALWGQMMGDLPDTNFEVLDPEDLGEKVESLMMAPVLRYNVIYDVMEDGPWTTAILVAVPPPTTDVSDDAFAYDEGALPAFELSVSVPGEVDEGTAVRFFRHLLQTLVHEAQAGE